MIVRLIALILVLGLAACGVKNDLDPPPGAIPQKGERDPSKPPEPLGQ
jgi:predicted small lipoprotein YifL